MEDEHLKQTKAKEEFEYKKQMKQKVIPTTLREIQEKQTELKKQGNTEKHTVK